MLRNFTEDSPLRYCFGSKQCPLIKITKTDIDYAQSQKEKIEMLKNRKKGDRFCIARAGQRSTDVFEVTEEDMKGYDLSPNNPV